MQVVCVLPARALDAGRRERRGPLAGDRCSGSQRRRTEEPRYAAAGFAGRCAPSLAGSY